MRNKRDGTKESICRELLPEEIHRLHDSDLEMILKRSKTLSEACLNFPKERFVTPPLSSPPLTSDESGEQFSGQPYNCSPNEAMDIGEDFEEKSKKSPNQRLRGPKLL